MPVKFHHSSTKLDRVTMHNLMQIMYAHMEPHKRYSAKQLIQLICTKIAISKEKANDMIHVMYKHGYILVLEKLRYVINYALITGHVDYVNVSYAYIIPRVGERIQKDIWVSQKNLSRALHGDLVIVVVTHQYRRKRERPTGELYKILQRNQAMIIGHVEQRGQHTFVIPNHPRMHHDICIEHTSLNVPTRPKDKVIVKITNWLQKSPYPTGTIQEVLGPSGVHEVETRAIMAEFSLPSQFPKVVMEEIASIASTLPKHELTRRKDFRDRPTFTIDPEHAQDFDDALSLRTLPGGHYEVGIHIADVSHYVDEGSRLDQEAYERGMSVYLVDRTIPMLPEKLSNNLCSLKPHEDRLAFSLVVELDRNSNIQREWLGETVIHSQQRFTYTQAQAIITQQSGNFCKELTHLHHIAQQLRSKRVQQGSINFSSTTIQFELDTDGHPKHIRPKVATDTHKLIEEFMILANVRMATRMASLHKTNKCKSTFVYRVHDQPDQDKLAEFWDTAASLGYPKPKTHRNIPSALNTILEATKGTSKEHLIHLLAMRAMAKATYTTEKKGHFGLAQTHYTHFTSPIRRYPDIMVHRLLKQQHTHTINPTLAHYQEKCQYFSQRERVATEAERASIRYKQVAWIQDQIGEVLPGIISGITHWGIYVTLDRSQCEGMVRLSDILEDQYTLDRNKIKLVGQHTKKVYQLGDYISVRIQSCDLIKRTITFTLVK